jgi:acetyl-CoA carboxylase biotin carboxyl carrier protein
MGQHDLSEIDLCEGDKRIRLRRGAKTVSVTTSPILPSPVGTQTPTPAERSTAPIDASPQVLHEIKSQLVGTFYSSAKPGAPPLIKIGDRVTPATVVGIIEAMKIFNEITADCDGVITEICVENQQPVEFEQVLFRVDPSA